MLLSLMQILSMRSRSYQLYGIRQKLWEVLPSLRKISTANNLDHSIFENLHKQSEFKIIRIKLHLGLCNWNSRHSERKTNNINPFLSST